MIDIFSMSFKYRIYCKDESTFQYTWSDEPPIVCPIDPVHEINPESVKKVSQTEVLYVFPTGNTTGHKNKYYKKVLSFPYNYKKYGKIRKIVTLSHMDSGMENYSVEVFDHDSGLPLSENTFTNTTPKLCEIDTSEFENYDDEIFIDVNLKVEGGNKKKAYLDTVIVYIEGDI